MKKFIYCGCLLWASWVPSLTVEASPLSSAISASPDTLDFQTQAVNSTSAPQTFTVTNKGDVEAALSLEVNHTDFIIKSNSCDKQPLAGGSECQINVVFKPSKEGELKGTLTVKSTEGEKLADGKLVGIGTGTTTGGVPTTTPTSKVTAKPTSIDFKTQALKASSAEKTVTLKNGGTEPVTLSTSLDNKKDFAIADTSTCGKDPLAGGSECQVNLTFKPSAAGDLQATLTVKAGKDTLATVALKGTGEAAATPTSKVTAKPTSIDFKTQALKASSAEKTVTLKNGGTEPVTLSTSLDNKKDFAIADTSTCGKDPLAGGSDCQVNLTFKPSAAGDLQATLTVKSGKDTLATVALKGTGEEGKTTSTVTAKPTSLDFKTQALKASSAEKTVTLKNDGTEPVTLSTSLDNKKDFAIADTSTCGKDPLAGGSECQVNLTFKPSAAGDLQATLTVKAGKDTLATVALKGTGEAAATPTSKVTAKPTSIDFKTQALKASSAEKTVTLKNGGTEPVTLSISLDNKKDFAIADTSTCGKDPLAGGSDCQVDLTFKPSVAGDLQATLTVKAGKDTLATVALKGVGEGGDEGLGKGIVLGTDGKFVEEPGVKFSGGVAVVGANGELGEFQSQATVSPQDKVTIQVAADVPPEQVDRTAEFFTVGFYSLTGNCNGKETDGVYFTLLDEQLQKEPWYELWACPSGESRAKDFGDWNDKVSCLKAFKTDVTLQKSNPLLLIDKVSFVVPGLLCFTVGYRLDDGTLHFHEQSIDVTITE